MEEKKNEKLLEVRDLQVSFFTPAGEVKAVNGISYDVIIRNIENTGESADDQIKAY